MFDGLSEPDVIDSSMEDDGMGSGVMVSDEWDEFNQIQHFCAR